MLFTEIASVFFCDVYKGHISTQAWRLAGYLNDAAGGIYSYHQTLNLAGGLRENCIVNVQVEI